MTQKPELLRLAKFLIGSRETADLQKLATKLERLPGWEEIVHSYSHPLLAALEADVVKFAETLSIIHPTKGSVPLNLYDYQAMALDQIQSCGGRTIAVASARQMGWSTIMAAYSLHYALSNDFSTQLVVGPRDMTAIEFGERMRHMIESRPDIATVASSKRELRFCNGSRVLLKAASSAATSTRGTSLAKIIVMDAANVIPRDLQNLLVSLSPTLASTKGQFIMQSTPRVAGDEFHRFYNSADLAIHQDWSLHPLRDASWKTHHVAALGQDKFESEFEAKFVIPS